MALRWRRIPARYFAATDALNVLRPHTAAPSPAAVYSWATAHRVIERLIAEDHAYVAEGNVYFDVASFAGYGKGSRRRARLEEQEASGRVEAGVGKRGAADFALWKKADPGHLMKWPSPWGVGFPGWQISSAG